MILMKAAYKNDWKAIDEIFKFWYERGFVDENKDIVLYFMEYVFQTQDISWDKLKKMLADSKIDGNSNRYLCCQLYPNIRKRNKY